MRPDPGVLRKQVDAWVHAGHVDQALSQPNNWLARYPGDQSTRALAADIAEQAGRPDEATAGYRRVLAACPKDAGVLNNLAWLDDLRSDPQALELAERAHRLAPQSALVGDRLGLDSAGRRADMEICEGARR
jgi:Flp pilus assembly protein TadD